MTSLPFGQHTGFTFKPGSILIFIAAALTAWAVNVAGSIIFPSHNIFPFLVRTIITIGTDLAIIYVSIRLLKLNGLPARALGLSISRKTMTDVVWGAVIGIAAVAMIAGVMFIFIPYHFVAGSFPIDEVPAEISFYIAGNFLEELLFRGFLFVILGQVVGWRMGALIMAIPFGLFHLQGTGLTVDGLRMVATTACYSLVFSFSFVLSGSLWTAVSVHVVSNVCLHTISGLDGNNRALFAPVFDGNWPSGYDPGFITMLLTALSIAAILYFMIARAEERQ